MDISKFQALLTKVQQKNPLIHQMTNNVTINDCANVTLAIGASPVMTTGKNDVADMANLADAVVINFGTINDGMYEAMLIAGKTANKKGIPVVVDPVGAGATPYRTRVIRDFFEKVDVAIVRGNVSEINALINDEVKTRGVDAGDVAESKQVIAETTANMYSVTTVISGETDIISNGKTTYGLSNGDLLLTKVTGTGCMSTALIASFAAVTDDWLAASIAGMAVMGIAGEVAKNNLEGHLGLGTFRVNLIDAISNFENLSLYKYMNISKLTGVIL